MKSTISDSSSTRRMSAGGAIVAAAFSRYDMGTWPTPLRRGVPNRMCGQNKNICPVRVAERLLHGGHHLDRWYTVQLRRWWHMETITNTHRTRIPSGALT